MDIYLVLYITCFSLLKIDCIASTWSEWWTYDGISGPDFWGLVNPEWSMCAKGKKQSPVNINPRQLLYDPSLRNLHVDKHRVGGLLMNTGQDIKIYIDEENPQFINISGGSLSYTYRVKEIIFHFGSNENRGSEHTIDDQAFPAEIQLLGYNIDLYGNLSQAISSAHGIVMVGLLAQIGQKPNMEFQMIAQEMKHIKYKGQQVRIRHLSVHGLLPQTHDYLTYEGSLTQPGCFEVATWIIMNKPIYISYDQIEILRNLMQGDESNPKVPMENNNRPVMPLHHRTVRTNINFSSPSRGCTMEKTMYYQANVWDRS